MTDPRPSYSELEERCRRAEGMLEAIRSGQVDTVVGEDRELVLRLSQAEAALTERVKELGCLYGISRLVEEKGDLAAILQGTVELLPRSWRHPEIARARILLRGREYCTGSGCPFPCGECPYPSQRQAIRVGGRVAGEVRVVYTEERPQAFEGPFLEEERKLLDAVAERLGRIAERLELQERLEHFRRIVENSPTILFRWRAEEGWPVAYVSENISRLGYDPEDFLSGRVPYDQMIHPEDLERVAAEVRHHSDSGEREFTQDYRILDRQGRIHWIADQTRILRDGEGRPLFYEGLIRDVTERREVEAALRSSEESHRTTLAAIGDAVIATDVAGRVTKMNPVAEKVTGWPLAEARGRPLTQVFRILHAHTRQEVENPVAKALATGDVVGLANHTLLIARDGRERQIADSAAPIRNDRGETTGVVLVFRDVSEDYAKAERLRFQAAVLDQIVDLVTVTDLEGRVTYVNNAVCRMFRKKREEILGTSVETYGEDPEKGASQREIIRETLRNGSWRGEVVNYDREGVEVVLDCRTRLLREESGRPFALCGISTDVTERKVMEQRLRQMEKMEAIGQLAGGVAHDFNNQLAGILGYAEMLAEQLGGNPLRDYADNILTGAKRAAELTQQLLAFARKGRYRTIPLDLHATIGEVISILEHTIDRRIVIRSNLGADPPAIMGDPTQIQNVLLNLALNARDAMPEGGELVFGTSLAELDEDYCRTLPYAISPGRYIRLTLSDTGCGMDEETQRRIFEPFFTTKEVGRGTGMGLAAVYGTVKNHGGAINVFSEPGQGTTFRIFLPACEAAPRQEEVEERRQEKAAVPARILVVDDEELVRDIAAYVLSRAGHEVTTSVDGESALAHYRDHWREIDLVVLDMTMPRMDGKEAFRAMREINPHLRVLLASGYSADSATQGLHTEGVGGFIQKPFSQAELLQAVRKALD